MTFYLNVVNIKKKIFSDVVKKIQVKGRAGDLGIFPGHIALLTFINPGMVHIVNYKDEEEFIYLSGGVLEVQPFVVTILADMANRVVDLDEARSLE